MINVFIKADAEIDGVYSVMPECPRISDTLNKTNNNNNNKTLLWAEFCLPPQIHMLKSQPPVPQYVNILEDMAFKEAINIK